VGIADLLRINTMIRKASDASACHGRQAVIWVLLSGDPLLLADLPPPTGLNKEQLKKRRDQVSVIMHIALVR
jgi:hypothetical protein